MTLDEFCYLHGLKVRTEVRADQSILATIDHASLRVGWTYEKLYGEGATMEEARQQLANQVAGGRVVYGGLLSTFPVPATLETRYREFVAPKDLRP